MKGQRLDSHANRAIAGAQRGDKTSRVRALVGGNVLEVRLTFGKGLRTPNPQLTWRKTEGRSADPRPQFQKRAMKNAVTATRTALLVGGRERERERERE